MTLDLIAQYYDLLYGNLEEDIPMWQALAEETTGPLLEVGCGTGRLLLPLAEAGYRLTGIDLSTVALSAARARLQAAGLSSQVSLVQADMRHFQLHRQNFNLAFVPLNTFMHCHTVEDQLATLQSIHAHLVPGGQLALDLFYPDPALLAEADGRLYFEAETVDDLTGRTVQWYWRHDIDLAGQMRHMVYVLDEVDEEGLVRRVHIPFSLRFFYRYEMELLLQAAGFEVKTIYGSYDLEPFHGHSQKMIFLATKR